jgi:hypothetical protein
MINDSVLDGFRKRYSHLHPLIFHRSVEKARDASVLFDILDSIPNKYPVVWDEKTRSWRHEEDVLLSGQLKEMKKKRD